MQQAQGVEEHGVCVMSPHRHDPPLSAGRKGSG